MRDDDSEDEEPTQLRRERAAGLTNVTVNDLRHVLERVQKESEPDMSAKVHDLSAMLRDAQRERLADAGLGLKSTLPSGTRPEAAQKAVEEFSQKAEERATRERGARRERSSASSPVLLLVVGALLVAGGILIERFALSRSGAEGVRLSWDIEATGTRLSIDGEEQPLKGSGTFPCSRGEVVVTAALEDDRSEQHRVPCGGELILRVVTTESER